MPSLVPGEPGPEQDLEKLPRTGFLQEIPTSRHDLLYPSEAPWRESHGFTDDVRPADPGTPPRGSSAAARVTSTWPHRSHADSRGAARRPANLHQLDRNQSAHWRRCKYFNVLTVSPLVCVRNLNKSGLTRRRTEIRYWAKDAAALFAGKAPGGDVVVPARPRPPSSLWGPPLAPAPAPRASPMPQRHPPSREEAGSRLSRSLQGERSCGTAPAGPSPTGKPRLGTWVVARGTKPGS